MAANCYLVKQPLFSSIDEMTQDQQVQLESLNVTIPISMTLLEQLNALNYSGVSLKQIENLLCDVVKNPSYFFPDVPLLFERQGISMFVPNDNSEHLLNWKSLIVQVHISLLKTLGLEKLKPNRNNRAAFEDLESSRRMDQSGSRGSGTMVGSRGYTGSISLRQQQKYVASFSKGSMGSMQRPSFENIEVQAAPQITRSISSETTQDLTPLELNPILDFTINCDFEENGIFRALILAIQARGTLDTPCGHIIASVISNELDGIGIKVGDVPDSTSAIEAYYTLLTRTFLTQEQEDQITNDSAHDNVGTVLDKIEQLSPFLFVSHTYKFLENILAPMCYHENPILASRATTLYHSLLMGHVWEISETAVTTADVKLSFIGSSEHTVIIAATGTTGDVYITSLGIGVTSFTAPGAGFYDYAYARVNRFGEFEVDHAMPSGRYIVLPSGARKEIIHELPAFDENGPIHFSKLTEKLDEIQTAGVTAVHVSGVIERDSIYSMTSVTDHTIISKACGGLDAFKEFTAKATQLGLRVMIDFIPLVNIFSSRKYNALTTLQLDERGRLLTASLPGSDNLLLNIRSISFWNLLAAELKDLIENCGVSGFFIGDVKQWDFALPRDKKELLRLDPDGELHYSPQNIIQGSVVLGKTIDESRGLMSHEGRSSPLLMRMMRSIWAANSTIFVWGQCEIDRAPYIIESGIIAQTTDFQDVLMRQIHKSTHCDDVYSIDAGKEFKIFFEKRAERLPKGSLCITPFGSLIDSPPNLTVEGLSLMIDLLFFLSDVPLIASCLPGAYHVPNAYKNDRTQVMKIKKWFPPSSKFSQLLKTRSASRIRADWVLSGEVRVLPVTYDGQENNAVLAVARLNPFNNHCALICTGFYQDDLIFEVTARDLPAISELPEDGIVEVRPLLSVAHKNSYYALQEVSEVGSSLFLEVSKFGTSVHELVPMAPPIPSLINRTLMEDVFSRLERSIQYSSDTVLAHNYLFTTILKFFEHEPTQEEMSKFIRQLPILDDAAIVLRRGLFRATRCVLKDGKLQQLTDEAVIEQREHIALQLFEAFGKSTDHIVSSIGRKVIESNTLGPVFFVAPELGPFSKVGGLSPMVWELAQELVGLGVEVHCISPYYNVNSKGETGYLKEYGIEYISTIEVYCPQKVELGVHKGIVNGVHVWFLHNYTYFSVPYQTGSASFRLQIMVLLTKGSLELCCREHIIPSLVISNDWMTGFTAAYARKSFGSVFRGTQFLHIFHNLGPGYSGKVWPSDGDLYALRSIHQLPDEAVIDSFDHSIDPSLCALLYVDQWATVSKKYRDELLEGSPYSYFLRRFEKPFAYSNGIREQERLEKIKQLGMDHAQAKAAVQQKYFGKADPNICLFIFVGRITEQKGVFLIIDSFEQLHREFNGRMQFIVGGQASPDDRTYGLQCTQRMYDLKNRYPNNFWADPSAFFSDGLLVSHGADYCLVPSLFEPSGIVQQEAFCSGTPVIAFRTGGLADTVFEYDPEKNTGNGFTFWAHRHSDYVYALQRAFDMWSNHKDLYNKMRENAFKSTLSTVAVATAWAREFCRLFNKIFESPKYAEELKQILDQSRR